MKFIRYSFAFWVVLSISALSSASAKTPELDQSETQQRLTDAAHSLSINDPKKTRSMSDRFAQWYNWNNWSNWGNWRNY